MSTEAKPLRVLLIKKKEGSLDQVEKHLIKKGYHVVSVVQLKMAVLKALEIKAEFILVPLDHPNVSVKQLPQVFTQLLKCHVIPYVETQTASAILDIRRQGLKYNILPPILGPKVERMLTRILFDQKSLDDIDRRRQDIQHKVSFGTDVIKVKGGTESANISVDAGVLNSVFNEYVKTNQAQASSIVVDKADPHHKQRSTDFFVSFLKKTPHDRLPAAWRRQEAEEEDMYQLRLRNALLQAENQDSVATMQKDFFDRVEVKAMENCLNRLQASGETLDEETSYDPSQTDMNRALVDVALAKGAPPEFLRKPHETPQAHLDRLNEAFQNAKLKSNLVHQYTKFQSQAEAGSELGLLNPEVNKVLDEATYKALLKVHERSEVKETQHLIQNTSRITCLVVENEKHKGYIVMTTAKDMILTAEFQTGVFQEFQSSLKEKGIEISEKDVHQIEVQAVPFIDWVSKKANFLKQSSFEGEEVGLAFFPVEKFEPTFSKSDLKELWQVKIAELRTRVPMGFDLYLNLPLNEKLLLYIPKGYQSVEKQLDRLHKKGVEVMYVKESALTEVKKYQAQNFFEDQIDVYQATSGAVRVRVVGE